MTIQAGAHRLGPENSSLKVKTYREGLASKAGHDLVIEVTRWEATVNVDGEGGAVDVQLSADPQSLEVREGHNGLKPISDKDRGDIRKNIEKKVLGGDPIGFSSTGSQPANGSLAVSGDLTVAGSTRPVTFALDVAPDGQVSGTIPMTQSEWGIKPYSGLMGALKVRDTVEIVIDARTPAG